MAELLIGAGNNRARKISIPGRVDWRKLTTLDMSPDCKPDVVHNLEVLPYPFEDNSFDEIHAYEVLEHMGRQGDWKFFFAQFDEFARILKPDGFLCATSPNQPSQWVWGDPGHTRYMGPEVYTFLSRKQYADQVGRTSMTDYRSYFKSDWEVLWMDPSSAFAIVLKNLK
jgi:SAM-dependent methyltransferase